MYASKIAEIWILFECCAYLYTKNGNSCLFVY